VIAKSYSVRGDRENGLAWLEKAASGKSAFINYSKVDLGNRMGLPK